MKDVLHIHGQYQPHADAFVLGNRAALEALRYAIDQVLTTEEHAVAFNTTTNDGEQFNCFVCLVTRNVDDLILPYTDESYVGEDALLQKSVIDPIGIEVYRQLTKEMNEP